MTDGGCDISKVGPITVEEVNNPDFFCFLAEFALCFLTALNVGAKKGICTSAFTLPDAAQYWASCPPMGDTLRRSLGWVVSMVTVTALLANLAI